MLADDLFDSLKKEGQKAQGRDPDRWDYEQVPLILKDGEKYPLHAGQLKVWKSEARHVAIIAGTRSGKTSLGPYWALREIQRKKGGTGLIVGPTFPLLDSNLVPECERAWAGMGEYKVGKKTFYFNHEGCKKLGVDEAIVVFRHADDPEGLESLRARWCWRDETGQSKFSRAANEAIIRRVAQDKGRILDTTTPYEFNWFKEDVWDRRNEADPKDLEVVSYRTIDNPSFPQEEWDRIKRSGMPAWRFQMMYEGQYTRPAGAIYDCFDRTVDVVPTIEPETDGQPWRRYIGIDFGQVHTFAVKLAEHPTLKDSEGYPVLFAYQEYFPRKSSYTYEHINALKKGEPSWPIRAVGGNVNSEKEARWEWTAAGLPVEEPWQRSVEAQVDRVYAAFKRGGLKIMDCCPHLISQLEEYSFELDASGEPIPGKIADKNKFHGPDALRAIVAQVRPNKMDEPKILRTGYFGEAAPGFQADAGW